MLWSIVIEIRINRHRRKRDPEGSWMSLDERFAGWMPFPSERTMEESASC